MQKSLEEVVGLAEGFDVGSAELLVLMQKRQKPLLVLK
jgi:hypothetical protein